MDNKKRTLQQIKDEDGITTFNRTRRRFRINLQGERRAPRTALNEGDLVSIHAKRGVTGGRVARVKADGRVFFDVEGTSILRVGCLLAVAKGTNEPGGFVEPHRITRVGANVLGTRLVLPGEEVVEPPEPEPKPEITWTTSGRVVTIDVKEMVAEYERTGGLSKSQLARRARKENRQKGIEARRAANALHAAIDAAPAGSLGAALK